VSGRTEQPMTGRLSRDRVITAARNFAADVAIGLMWAALVVAIVLFSGAASQFVYVDF